MTMNSNRTSDDLLQLLTELEKPEIQESLKSLLHYLPNIQKSVEVVENVLDFGKSVFQDEQALNKYEHLASTYNMNLETIEAGIVLIEKLPKLVKMLEQVENLIDFTTAVLQDKQTTEYAAASMKGYIDPIIQKGNKGKKLWQEVQQQVSSNTQPVKIMSIIKWMKDPTVQKVLQYVQATLEVLNNKKK